jgi:hypothetical protein
VADVAVGLCTCNDGDAGDESPLVSIQVTTIATNSRVSITCSHLLLPLLLLLLLLLVLLLLLLLLFQVNKNYDPAEHNVGQHGMKVFVSPPPNRIQRDECVARGKKESFTQQTNKKSDQTQHNTQHNTRIEMGRVVGCAREREAEVEVEVEEVVVMRRERRVQERERTKPLDAGKGGSTSNQWQAHEK